MAFGSLSNGTSDLLVYGTDIDDPIS